jgi:BASS family bile acid:Na+ symporter
VGDDVSTTGVAARVFLITVLPLSVGMRLRARDPAWAATAEPTAKRLAFGVFLLVVAGAVISEFGEVSDHLGELASAAITLNVAAMSISFAVARLARLTDRQATAIAMELGLHNATVAIAIGASVDELVTIPAAVYSSFMFVTAGAFARVMARRNAAVVPSAAS